MDKSGHGVKKRRVPGYGRYIVYEPELDGDIIGDFDTEKEAMRFARKTRKWDRENGFNESSIIVFKRIAAGELGADVEPEREA